MSGSAVGPLLANNEATQTYRFAFASSSREIVHCPRKETSVCVASISHRSFSGSIRFRLKEREHSMPDPDANQTMEEKVDPLLTRYGI